MSAATVIPMEISPLRKLVEDERFKRTVLALIVVSAALLGLETARTLPAGVLTTVTLLNRVILGLFVIELLLRIAAYRLEFFRDPWSVFDFAVVAVSLISPSGAFQVVRSLRILRAVRLVSTVPSLRRVVEGLLGAVAGIASVLFLLLVVLYIAGVMATMLFRDVAPEYFGHLAISLFSLFQIMTLEGWADIALEVMAQREWAWVFFVGYILIATFLVLNLVIGVVVSSIQSRIEGESVDQAAEQAALRREVVALRQEIHSLRAALDR